MQQDSLTGSKALYFLQLTSNLWESPLPYLRDSASPPWRFISISCFHFPAVWATQAFLHRLKCLPQQGSCFLLPNSEPSQHSVPAVPQKGTPRSRAPVPYMARCCTNGACTIRLNLMVRKQAQLTLWSCGNYQQWEDTPVSRISRCSWDYTLRFCFQTLLSCGRGSLRT